MATVEHCLFCFEALNAALNNTAALTLGEIEASWTAYNSSVASARILSPKVPALQRVAAAAADSDSASSSASSLAPSTPATSTSPPTPMTLDAAPLFVTWNVLNDNDYDDDDDDDDDDDYASGKRLRGCIGTFESQPLADGLSEFAVFSALHDTRFPPISRREFPTLQVAVTLLTDFEEAADARDWDIGTHGIHLSFHDKGRRYGTTFLPDVAVEQGWTKDETLLSLVQKAGWKGSRSRWQDLDLKVTRYQGKKRTLNYSQYSKWKEWVAARQA